MADGLIVHALRLRPGEDLRARLEAYVREQSIQAAFVIGAVGSLRSAKIRYADAATAVEVEGPLEIVSLIGTFAVNGAHLHVAVADGEGRVRGGHLGMGSAVHTTAEVVIGESPRHRFEREPDAQTGYGELTIRGRTEGGTTA